MTGCLRGSAVVHGSGDQWYESVPLHAQLISLSHNSTLINTPFWFLKSMYIQPKKVSKASKKYPVGLWCIYAGENWFQVALSGCFNQIGEVRYSLE